MHYFQFKNELRSQFLNVYDNKIKQSFKIHHYFIDQVDKNIL